MWFLLFLCLFGQSEPIFRIRKCCNSTSLYNYENCVALDDLDLEIDAVNTNTIWPWWFPRNQTIIQRDTKQPLKVFPKDAAVEFMAPQPCCTEDATFFPLIGSKFYDDGALVVQRNYFQTSDIEYRPLSYCIDRTPARNNSQEEFMVTLCPCNDAICTLKCCSPGMSLKINGSFHGNVKYSADNCFWIDEPEDLRPEADDFIMLHHFPKCKQPDEVISVTSIHSDDDYELYDNGSAAIRRSDGIEVLEKMKFCVENVFREGSDEAVKYVFSCSRRSSTISARNVLYGSLSAIGAAFLLATIFIYSFIISEWTVNDKNLIAQVWSLLFGYIGLTIVQFGLRAIPHVLCVILGYMILYSFLASFFWLNVLCVDLAWTFSEVRMIKSMQVWQKRRRFIQYSAYAWLSPAIIVIVAIAIDNAPNLPSYVIKAEISDQCWFSNESLGKLAYFYGPVAFLLVVNVVLFVYTVYKIHAVRQQTSRLLQDQTAKEKVRTWLYVKLFCLMGLSWAFELLSWLVGGPDYYWYLTDMANLLRAVFIFVTLCWKKVVFEQLKDRLNFPRRRGRQRPSPSIDTAHSTLSIPPPPNSHTTPF